MHLCLLKRAPRWASALASSLVVFTLLCAPLALAKAAKTDVTGVVNLNEAEVKQLILLPGIGAAKAKRIVTYRAKRRFKRAVELARVRGIGLKTVRKLKPFLTISGPSTLKRTRAVRAPSKP